MGRTLASWRAVESGWGAGGGGQAASVCLVWGINAASSPLGWQLRLIGSIHVLWRAVAGPGHHLHTPRRWSVLVRDTGAGVH